MAHEPSDSQMDMGHNPCIPCSTNRNGPFGGLSLRSFQPLRLVGKLLSYTPCHPNHYPHHPRPDNNMVSVAIRPICHSPFVRGKNHEPPTSISHRNTIQPPQF